MGWATLVVGWTGAIGLLFVVVFVMVLSSMIRKTPLGPPSVRGLSAGEQPRYLELATEPARRQFEGLGFRVSGHLATQPINRAEAEIVQLVMQNDDTRTVAYFHVRDPFTEARPATVSFESFLADGSIWGTRERFLFIVGPELPNRRRSAAPDDQGIYRDHLAALGGAGLRANELPTSFDGLVASNVADAARIWTTRLEQGVIVAGSDGAFHYSLWSSLACIPRLLFGQLRRSLVEASRRRSDQARGPIVDSRVPELRQFLDERGRRQKRTAEAASTGLKMSRTRTAVLWVAMVIAFTVMWRFLSHRPR